MDCLQKKGVHEFNCIFKWFNKNHMKGNADKNHFLVSSNLELPSGLIIKNVRYND